MYCADERSQHKNRAKAMTVLRSRLLKAKEEEEHAKYAAEKRANWNWRSIQRIRTYNYPQGRLTDHRIGMNFSLPGIIEGNIEALIDALHNVDYEARMKIWYNPKKGNALRVCCLR